MDFKVKQKTRYQNLASNMLRSVTPERALCASSLVQVKSLLSLTTTAEHWELKNTK